MTLPEDRAAVDRYLDAFVGIENHLKEKYGRPGTREDFSTLLVQGTNKGNAVLRQFRNELHDFADLRNVLVHRRYRNGGYLAVPNEAASTRLIRIGELLRNPPRVFPLFRREVETASPGQPVGEVLERMYDLEISQVPVYEGDGCVGLLTTNAVARWLAANVKDEIVSLRETSVANVLEHREVGEFYTFVGCDETLFGLLDIFRERSDQGRRVAAVIITHSGRPQEKPLGIVTVDDLPEALRGIGRE